MLTKRNLGEQTAEGNEITPLSGFMTNSASTVPPMQNIGGSGDGDSGDEACTLVFVNLAAYQDRELDPDQQAVVEAHLNRCPRCTAQLTQLQELDAQIEREWRESTPLPSSSQFKHSIDAIMAALPDQPVAAPEYAQKRIHARARWMRFSTGMAGIVALFSMLWSSYRLGYAHGQSNNLNPRSTPSTTPSQPNPRSTTPMFSLQNASLQNNSSAPDTLLEANLIPPPTERNHSR